MAHYMCTVAVGTVGDTEQTAIFNILSRLGTSRREILVVCMFKIHFSYL